jgi:hypothetical protein
MKSMIRNYKSGNEGIDFDDFFSMRMVKINKKSLLLQTILTFSLIILLNKINSLKRFEFLLLILS